MQLSILLPTHRHDLGALSRAAQACSWAAPDIEVIVRDNSGNADKREILRHFKRDNCQVVLAEPCEPLENFSACIRMARGKFVFVVADDDMGFDRAIATLPHVIDQIGGDRSVIGICGPYIVEGEKGSTIINYKGIDSADVVARVAGYLGEIGPNALFYVVQRREVLDRILGFLETLPVFCSFHDQIQALLQLLSGRFHLLPRVFYLYDFGVWEDTTTGQQRDARFYTAAGLDPAVNLLHWFLCGFEGAVLALHSDIFPDHPPAQRQAVANQWFSTMFARFRGHKRLTFGSAHAGEVEKLCAKLQTAAGTVSFDGMLGDIAAAFGVFSKSKAQAYFDYWNAMLNKRKLAAPASNAPKLAVGG